MQAPSWIALLKLIPGNLHDTLVMITTTNIEVMVQRLLRIEEDYLVFRGRMSGTMDGARVMVMPYDQISNIAFNKRMLEAEVDTIFANSGGYIPIPLPAKNQDMGSESTSTDMVEAEQKVAANIVSQAPPPPAQPQPPTAAPVVKPEHASKSILLARLRARLNGSAKK